MASDEEGEFFVEGVDSSVHDLHKKRRLTKYHGKLGRYPYLSVVAFILSICDMPASSVTFSSLSPNALARRLP